LFKIKAANDVAAADVNAAQSKTQQTENQIVLRIHQIYYRILIAQAHREAVAAKATANEAMESERIAQVRQGSALQEEAIESKAQVLQTRQEMLATELQISDLVMELNDTVGLPLATSLVLDRNVPAAGPTCEREECLRVAREGHPEIAEARAELEKA